MQVRGMQGRGMQGRGKQANVGDHLRVHSNTVGSPDRIAEIVEVRGEHGTPPYLVRFPDGHQTLVFPGPDSVVERSRTRSRLSRRFLG
jgi:hypothetical protein